MYDEPIFDDEGRFQWPTDELGDLVRFLNENKVRCEVETEVSFRTEGRPYGVGRLLHPFDTDEAIRLYHLWREEKVNCPPDERRPG